MVHVNGVTPPKLKPLDEVRAQAIVDWTSEQRGKLLATKAVSLTAQADKDKSLDNVAKDLKVTVQHSPALTRQTNDTTFSSAFVQRLFDAPPGSIVIGASKDVRQLHPGQGHRHRPSQLDPRDPGFQGGAAQLSQAVAGDFSIAMANAAREHQGVKVNQKTLALPDRQLSDEMILPAFDDFATGYASGHAQLLYTRLVADMETPVSAFLKLGEGKDNAFLLESVQGGEVRGRYSIIGIRPDLIWRCRDGKAEINRNAINDTNSFVPERAKPLESLRALTKETRAAVPNGLPPMATGLFGYLGYDMARQVENLPNPPPDTLGLPDAILLRPTITAIFDSVKDEIIVITPVWPEKNKDGKTVDAKAAYARATERLIKRWPSWSALPRRQPKCLPTCRPASRWNPT